MKNKRLKTYLKFGILFFGISVSMLNCDNESIQLIETEQSDISFEIIIPSDGLNEIFGDSNSQRQSNPIFGQINLEQNAKKISYSSGVSQYTFVLHKTDVSSRNNDFQYTTDNLSVKLNPNGSYETYIFRYIPDMSWFNVSSNTIDSYTGDIQLLDTDSGVLDEFTLENGEPITNNTASRSSARSTGSCEIKVTTLCTGSLNGIDSDFLCDVIISVNCPSGGGDYPDGGVPSEPNEDNPNTGGGNDGGGVSTNPILDTCLETNTCEEEEDIDPCDNLKQKLSNRNANVKPKLEELKNLADETVEHGVQFKKSNGVYSNPDIPVGNGFSVPIASGGDNYGGVHTHPNIGIDNMFSWGDMYVLANLYNNAATDVKDEVVFMLVTKECTLCAQASVYAISVTDINALNLALNNDLFNIVSEDKSLNFSSSLDDKIRALVEYNNYTPGGDNERVFLEQYANHGVKLYKANDELSNWSELEYNSSIGTVFENPCN